MKTVKKQPINGYNNPKYMSKYLTSAKWLKTSAQGIFSGWRQESARIKLNKLIVQHNYNVVFSIFNLNLAYIEHTSRVKYGNIS